MPTGPVLNEEHPLITAPGGGKIYLLDGDGKKRWIQDPNTFNRYNFDWSKVVQVDVGKYEEGPVIEI